MLLMKKQDEGLLREWETPQVYMDAQNPGLCIVEVGFTVTRVVIRIVIRAAVTI